MQVKSKTKPEVSTDLLLHIVEIIGVQLFGRRYRSGVFNNFCSQTLMIHEPSV